MLLGQFRFLQSFDLTRVDKVLDLSEDFGGVSHFIADHVGQIESVKIDPALAQLSANRCANKHNVCHISSDLDKLILPPKHYDLVVIGQLEALGTDQASLESLLTNIQAALSDTGVLVLCAVNSDRINKWLNKQSIDSQKSLSFADLYPSMNNSEIIDEVTRKQLRDTVLNCDFASVDIHALFSSGNTYKAIFSEDYLTASVDGVNHFYQLGSIDNADINEFLLYKKLVDEKRSIVDYSNHFLALAGATSSAVRQLYDKDFCHFPKSATKPQWQTLISRNRSGYSVDRQAVYADQPVQPTIIDHALTDRRFHKGPLLVRDWLDAALNHDHRHFENLVQEYTDWLGTLGAESETHSLSFDIAPSKIIVHQRAGERIYFRADCNRLFNDKSDAEVTLDFLLFRALYWFAQENKTVVADYAEKHDIYSIGLFIVEHMPTVHQIDELNAFADLEDQIQTEIQDKSSISAVQILAEPFNLTNSNEPNSQQSDSVERLHKTITAQNTSLVGQSHRLKLLRVDNEHQTQRISDLIAHRQELVEKLKEHEEDSIDLESDLRAEIDHLHERLHDQHQRNDELHGYLLMRPATRAKRVAKRTLNRLTGRPTVEPEPLPEQVEIIEEIDESPLPKGELIGQNTEDYSLWISENSLTEADIKAAKADIEAMPLKPVFSILVPIYNTDPEYLLPMIESVQNQIYPYWQLCLVDDCSPKSYLKRILEHESLQDERISIQLNDVNQGISVTTNDAMAMATGDYIALLDHDDEITINALYENAKVINATPDVGLIYSDEDKLNMKGVREEPYFKPDYSPDLLCTNNYICHFTVIKKSIAMEIGGFREGLDGSQDHDIIIRSAALAERVVHIPKILYHWRKIPGSTAVEYDSKSYAWEAGRRAVEDQLQKNETDVRVEFGALKGTYRVHREVKGEPLVSIIIPFKDKPELLESCLNSILNRSSYQNFEIVGISNNSEHESTQQCMAHYSTLDQRIRFLEKNIPFNFSALCNFGVAQAKGEYIVLLNNDIEIISPDWIQGLLEHAQRDEIGAVGGKLLFPDGTIQHAGVVAGMVGAAGHPHKFFPDNHIGYHGRLCMVQNVSAVTGAMMMMKAEKFNQVDGLDEENLAVAYNDIDLCLKLLNQGYRNVFTPHVKATHYESISRGYEDTDEKMQRLIREQKHFLTTWAEFLNAGDPYYNPNLSLKNERFSMKFID